MKFFWKIYFCTMFISVCCFSIGGFFLIQTGFNFALKNEMNAVSDRNDVVTYALNGEIDNQDFSITSAGKSNLLAILDISDSIEIFQGTEKLQFAILDCYGTTVYSSLKQHFAKENVLELGENKKGLMIRQKNDEYYIQSLSPIRFWGETYYVETLKDISNLYRNQHIQYRILLAIISGMLLLAGSITYMIIRLLFKRVDYLIRAMSAISNGKMNKRVKIKSDDEFADLSTSFNKMADNLEQKVQELEENAQNKELFIAAFSHELKTPLTSIVGYSDMLRNKEATPERTKLCADYIFKEGKRLESLSMKLLELIVHRNQEFSMRDVFMPDFFADISETVLPQLKDASINFKHNIAVGSVKMEEDLMKTVFINIIDNARKSMESGGQISLVGKNTQEGYVVTVTDTGRGMSEDDIKKVKEAFYVVDKSRARKQGGAGLGLAICDEILKLHGFEICFKSQEGYGTTVSISMKEGLKREKNKS